MHHFYVPCSQQEGHQGFPQQQPRSFQSSFRRPSSQISKDVERRSAKASHCSRTGGSIRIQTHDHDSSTSLPSLESSSLSCLEDEASPKTPSPGYVSIPIDGQRIEKDTSGLDLSASRQVATRGSSVKEIHVPFATNTASIARVLPSRSKRNDGRIVADGDPAVTGSQTRNYDVAPPVIQETVYRSRLAREVKRDSGCELQASDEVNTNTPNAVITVNSRCHARRRPCADARVPSPPKLRRDTDCTDAIVRLIVCLSTKLVHAIWSQSASTPKTSSAFNGAGVLPLKVFIQETLRRSKTSYSTLQVALYYLILLKPHVNSYHGAQEQNVPACRALQCGRRMFLTALILASKYLQDRNYSSRAWSKISGLPITEINENERHYLNLIQFNLHMKKEAFENWSKITLSLCKIGESSMTDNVSMVSDPARTGSDSWWSYQLRRLTADLVQDSQQTDDYLASLTNNKTANTVSSEQLTASFDTPPSSPDNTDEGSTENTLVKMLSNGSSDSSSNSNFAEFNSGLTAASDLPSRPNLPNLPTPSTTPRYNNVLPWPKGLCHPSTRCQASSQALLNLDKQAMNVANLDTCPPPRPRPCDLPRSMSFPTKRAPSSLGTALVATSLTCSPESTMSDTSCSTTRSRSSSISSNSSVWFASGRQDCQTDTATASLMAVPKESRSQPVSDSDAPASYSFYHPTGRVLSRFEDEGIMMHPALQEPQSLIKRTTKFLDEGYGSDGLSETDKLLIQQKIANTLASMEASKDWAGCPAVTTEPTSLTSQGQVQRRHKRAYSSTAESSLHDEVRQLVWRSQSWIDVVDTPSSTSYKAIKDKQVQYPEREWADLKRPVPNNLYNKRIALQHHTDVAGNAAAELAARYLRDVAMVN